ncbi:MAG: hypothetical protein LKF43_00255 [Streptococcaceae bacterium]|jgi:tetrahydromethanopterin S-methyltransferase subunit B|nr:hypothetical protein [Streptococcaceae bacterium]
MERKYKYAFLMFWFGCLLGLITGAYAFGTISSQEVKELHEKVEQLNIEVADKTNSLYEARTKLERYEGEWVEENQK